MVALIVGIIGVVATIVAPFLVLWWTQRSDNQKLRTHNNLLRTWRSTWQTNSASGNEWVTEDVNVEVAKGKLRFANDGNNQGYQWTGGSPGCRRVVLMWNVAIEHQAFVTWDFHPGTY